MCFMFGDTCLAIHKFVTPLPMSPVRVQSSYCLARVLIVAGMLRAGAAPLKAGAS